MGRQKIAPMAPTFSYEQEQLLSRRSSLGEGEKRATWVARSLSKTEEFDLHETPAEDEQENATSKSRNETLVLIGVLFLVIIVAAIVLVANFAVSHAAASDSPSSVSIRFKPKPTNLDAGIINHFVRFSVFNFFGDDIHHTSSINFDCNGSQGTQVGRKISRCSLCLGRNNYKGFVSLNV
ncbi:hypothetical protein T439DRAFT_382228 [Meredithblackwellia eburnea MCA 4105]